MWPQEATGSAPRANTSLGITNPMSTSSIDAHQTGWTKERPASGWPWIPTTATGASNGAQRLQCRSRPECQQLAGPGHCPGAPPPTRIRREGMADPTPRRADRSTAALLDVTGPTGLLLILLQRADARIAADAIALRGMRFRGELQLPATGAAKRISFSASSGST
jgi:hypothetical protein